MTSSPFHEFGDELARRGVFPNAEPDAHAVSALCDLACAATNYVAAVSRYRHEVEAATRRGVMPKLSAPGLEPMLRAGQAMDRAYNRLEQAQAEAHRHSLCRSALEEGGA